MTSVSRENITLRSRIRAAGVKRVKMADEGKAREDDNYLRLNQHNYYVWAIRTQAGLVEKNCWNAVDPGFDDVEELNAEQARTNRRALAHIFRHVNDEYLQDIGDCERAREAWKTLEEIHATFTLLHTVMLMKEMVNVEKTENISMQAYMSRIQDTYRKVSKGGITFTDKQIAMIFLMGLPLSKYEGLIRSMEQEGNLTTRAVKARLLVEEKRVQRENDRKEREEGPTALTSTKSHPFSRNQPNNRGEKKNHHGGNSKMRGSGINGNKMINASESKCFECGKWGHVARNCDNPRCYACGNRGHVARECDQKRAEINRNRGENENKSEVATDRFRACILRTPTSNYGKSSWVVDSGASDYMTPHREFFSTFKELRGSVALGKGRADVKGVGTVNVNLTEACGGWTLGLTRVLYVPELECNLISVKRLADNGIRVTFDKNSAIGSDDGVPLFTARESGGLYLLDCKEESRGAVAVSESETTSQDPDEDVEAIALRTAKMWHQRLGHLHEAAINKIPGLKEVKEDEKEKCTVCIRGKMTRKGFPKQSDRKLEYPLDMVHSDLMGKICPTSNGGAQYILTFTDDFSRYLRVYFLAKKSETFDKFLQFKAEAENFQGTKLKSIQTDGGGEYCSDKFESFLKQNGIVHRKTVPYCPQQNGVSERQNRTLADMIRCLIIQSGVPANFWAEAANTACYIRNLCPSRAIGDRSPFELWTGESLKEDDLQRLKVFGCRAWLAVESEGKFGSRAEEYVFLGYEQHVK